MKKLIFFLSGVIVALTASAGINADRDVSAPYNMYVDPDSHSCLVTWEDEENSQWNLRYRPYSEEPDEPLLLHSITASAYSGNSYNSITLPAPWGGKNVRAGHSEIYFRNNYNNDGSYGNITYTVPEGYTDATFTLMITSYNGSNGVGTFTVETPQTPAVTNTFAAGSTFYWVVTASSGEMITITTSDAQYSPSISLMAVYWGDASGSKLRAKEWTYAYNLVKTEYTIEDLDPETDYEVQVQAVGDDGELSDWCKPDVFTTLAEGEEPIIPIVHIMGEIDDQVWAPDAGTKMEYDPETETYTATVHAEAGATFGFTTEIDDNNEGGWEYILPYRFGPESNGEFYLTEERIGQTLTLSFDLFSDVYVMISADYDITVSLEQKYIIIGVAEHNFRPGDVNHDGDVDIKDVTDLIDFLLGESNGVCTICADVNGDDDVDIKDVTDLIDSLL